MKYIRIPQPKDSWNENPCWDCIFGKEDGECHAPQEIIDDGQDCGFNFVSLPHYIYVEDKK